MADKTAFMNLIKLVEQFRSEDACREYLERLRWPEGVECPRCQSKSVSEIHDRNQFDCNSCRYQFSVTAGTIFHDTHLPLWKWFAAIYLMIESKKGMSANQLKRTLGVSYKTAWYLCHRIRAAMSDDDAPPLKGTIEIDETFVGGKTKGRDWIDRKACVVGAVERGGAIRLQVIAGRDRESLREFIQKHTDPKTERYITDAWMAYRGIGDDDTRHDIINHHLGDYVDGDIHTNTVENVWSLLKRSIVGSYHKVSVKHLDRYLDELEWRFTNRENPFLFRDTLRRMLDADSLQYAALTS